MDSTNTATAQPDQFPKETKIFFFVFIVILGGVAGFLSTALLGIFWVQALTTVAGFAVGALIGYPLCLKSFFTDKCVYDGSNTLETAETPTLDALTEDKIEWLDAKEKSRRTRFNAIMIAWGGSVVFALILGFVSPSTPFAIGLFAYGTINIIGAITIITIISKRAGSYMPKNAVTTTGIVTGSVLIGGGNQMAHRVGVAVLNIDRLLIAYVRSPLRTPPYQKGDRVQIMYNPQKRKKCRILR